MKSKILGMLAVGLLAGPMGAQATVVYQFSLAANGDVGPVQITLTSAAFIPDANLATLRLSDPSISFSFGTPLNLTSSVIGVKQDGAEFLYGLALFDLASNDLVLLNPNYPADFFRFTRAFNEEGIFASTAGLITSTRSIDTRNPVATLCVSSTGACGPTVPEPGTLALLGLGLAGLGLSHRRKAN